MSDNNDDYDHSSGPQDSNLEWDQQLYPDETRDYTYHDAQQDPAQYNASDAAEASYEDNSLPPYHGHFQENPVEPLDHLHRRPDRKFYCQDTQTGLRDCTYSCPERSHLKKHLRSHVKPVLCPFRFTQLTPMCYHQTAEQRDMKRHVRSTHHEWARIHNLLGPRISCDRCGAEFTREDNLLRHVGRRHG
ncbi:hypothetical protein PspLS_04266, partial [Pyricularia sp. CBS 133598]